MATTNTSTGSSILSTLTSTAILPMLAKLEPPAIAYATEVAAKGLRAKHPNAAPTLEADVAGIGVSFQSALAGALGIVSGVKAITADLAATTTAASQSGATATVV